MHDDETLADWIGDDAARRFSKIPPEDVPDLMDWVLDIRDMPDLALTDTAEAVIRDINTRAGTIPHAQFRNAVLHFEAQRRHQDAGHEDNCVAGTAYSTALKRVTSPDTPPLPTLCGCPDVPLPPEWDETRRVLQQAGWDVTLHDGDNGVWMDLTRKGGDHMAWFQPFHGDGYAMVYRRGTWRAVDVDELLLLAHHSVPAYQNAVTRMADAPAAAAPPYIGMTITTTFKLPPAGSGRTHKVQRITRHADILIDVDEPTYKGVIPVPAKLLTPAERAQINQLTALSVNDYRERVREWISASARLSPRPFLTEPLAPRTLQALLSLNREPLTETQEKARRYALRVLREADVTLIASRPLSQQEKADLRNILMRELQREAPTVRNQAYYVLTRLFPEEIADLRERHPENRALEALKKTHYPLYNRIRRSLQTGSDMNTLLTELLEETRRTTSPEAI